MFLSSGYGYFIASAIVCHQCIECRLGHYLTHPRRIIALQELLFILYWYGWHKIGLIQHQKLLHLLVPQPSNVPFRPHLAMTRKWSPRLEKPLKRSLAYVFWIRFLSSYLNSMSKGPSRSFSFHCMDLYPNIFRPSIQTCCLRVSISKYESIHQQFVKFPFGPFRHFRTGQRAQSGQRGYHFWREGHITF